jgi:hypothetical protein
VLAENFPVGHSGPLFVSCTQMSTVIAVAVLQLSETPPLQFVNEAPATLEGKASPAMQLEN